MNMREKIVCVEWDDASFDSGFYDRKDPDRYVQLKTNSVGHLIKSTPTEIIIGTDCWQNLKELKDYRHITTIPKKMIRKIIVLGGKDALCGKKTRE